MAADDPTTSATLPASSLLAGYDHDKVSQSCQRLEESIVLDCMEQRYPRNRITHLLSAPREARAVSTQAVFRTRAIANSRVQRGGSHERQLEQT